MHHPNARVTHAMFVVLPNAQGFPPCHTVMFGGASPNVWGLYATLVGILTSPMCTTALDRVTYRNVHYSSRSYVGVVQVYWGAFCNVYSDARDDCSSPTCTIRKFMVTHPNASPS